MDILAKISTLMKEQNKQQKDLTDFLGVHKNAYTDWKSGKSKSYKKYLYQIADYLGVTPDYLLGKTDNKESSSAEEQHDELAKRLFSIYSDLSEEGKQQILDYAQFLCGKEDKDK